MGALKAYAPRDDKYVEAKNKLVNNIENFCKGREKIIEGFKNGEFPVYYDDVRSLEKKMKKMKKMKKKKKKKNKSQ